MRYEPNRCPVNERRAAVRRPDGYQTDQEPWSQNTPAVQGNGQYDGTPRAVAVVSQAGRAGSAGEVVDGLRQGRDYDLVLLDMQSAERLNLSVIRDLQLLGDETIVVIVNNGGGDGSLLQRVLAGNLAVTAGEEMPAQSPGVIERGFLRIDPRANQVTWKDELVPLTIAEFNIVRLFATRLGEAICYRDIYDVVHGAGFHAGDGENGYHTNVRSLVKRIRKKFLGVDPEFSEIENHRAFGYRWRTEPRQPAARRALRGN
jgi:two-component system response regulator ChvI